jgi:DNA-directed RNA polymerase specialized sigma24 family protein
VSTERTETDPALLALVALLAADRSERDPEPQLSTELVLASAGLSHQQIAAILGKKPDAVRMKISRAKASAPGVKGKGPTK